MLLQINTAEIDSIHIVEANQTITIRGMINGTPFVKGIVRELQKDQLTYTDGKALLFQGKINELCTAILNVP